MPNHELISQKCVRCTPDSLRLNDHDRDELLKELSGWKSVKRDDIDQLTKSYRFKNFLEALNFTNKVGEIAERENHHPSIVTEWGKVGVSWWTHSIKGLHKNDFILAARTENLYKSTLNN